MSDRFKSRKQAIKFKVGKTATKAKLRRKALHVINPETGRSEWKEQRWNGLDKAA